MLTKSIMAGLSAEQIAIQEDSWYEEQNIYQILDRSAVKIDADEKEVELSDGTRLKYTKLVYALGAECFVPPIPGADKEEVVTIRHLSDVEKTTALLEHTKNAVVIGGGVLGLEAAWELKKAKCQVTVLELAPQLMGRQLDEPAGELLKELAERAGVQIHTGVQIAAIEGDDHVTGVKLGDATVIPAELVIVSCGVRANTGLASQAGVAIDRAIVVDEQMRTNVENIYACGDCAQYKGANFAIWPEASEQGRVAGANAAGDEVEYKPEAAALSFHGMNTAIYALGDAGKNPNLLYKTVEFKDKGKGHYEKYYFLNNRLCGIILIGDVSKMAKLTEAVNRGARFQDVVTI
jgi:NAD(P)H-nitrite reductase large subunit